MIRTAPFILPAEVLRPGAQAGEAERAAAMTRRRFTSVLGLLAVGGPFLLARSAAGAAAERDVLRTPESIWADLLEGNRRFVAGRPRARELVRSRQALAEGQHPRVIVLGCADSRVSPELVFDKGLGDLFVVRTAGNIADLVALGSIEYAAEHLHARVLVVLGHERCGAVTAAASGEAMPTPNLEAIVKKIAPALEPLKGRARGEELVRLGVEANVHQSAKDILASSPIVRHAAAEGKLTIIKAVYRLRTGEVVRLA